MADKIRVAVIDDHPLFREGVIHTLGAQDDMIIIGEGSTADDAVQIAGDCLPDVLLLDLNLEGDAMNALGTIASKHPSVSILTLTVVAAEECVTSAIRLGATGYVLKGVSGAELANNVRTVSHKELYVSPSLATQVLRRLCIGSAPTEIDLDRFSELTDREHQILTLVSQALSNKEIALRTSLTEKTVKHHLTNILKKLPARNRVEAALLAAQRAFPSPKGQTEKTPLLLELPQG